MAGACKIYTSCQQSLTEVYEEHGQRKRHTALIVVINMLPVLTMMFCGCNSQLLLLTSPNNYLFRLSF